MARDAVMGETPASRATSLSLEALRMRNPVVFVASCPLFALTYITNLCSRKIFIWQCGHDTTAIIPRKRVFTLQIKDLTKIPVRNACVAIFGMGVIT
jgi:hypothetical protein